MTQRLPGPATSWAVERTLGRLARNRRLARDYETMITMAVIHLLATRLAGERTRWSNRTM